VNTSSNVIRDAQGHILGLLASFYDITELRRLRNSEALLSALVETSDDIIVVKDKKLRVVAANTAFARAAGKGSRSELIGKTDAEIFGVSTEEEPVRSYMEDERAAQLLAQGQKIEKEETVICADGTTAWVLTRKYPLHDSTGALLGTGNISHDITKLKEAVIATEKAREAAEAANKAKSDFLANMSHEIRTPLNGVIGFLDLLGESKLSPTQKQYVETARSSAYALLDVISDILDFSKIEAGKLDVHPVKTDLLALLEQTVDIVKPRMHKKNLELLLRADLNAPRFVEADSIRLRQVFVNLLGNAEKFTHTGEVEISMEVRPTLNPNKFLYTFSVRDTGIGISLENQQKIFEPFLQAEMSTTRSYGGTGLGLAITREILGRMGSSLQIESTPGQGSRFYFEIELPYLTTAFLPILIRFP